MAKNNPKWSRYQPVWSKSSSVKNTCLFKVCWGKKRNNSPFLAYTYVYKVTFLYEPFPINNPFLICVPDHSFTGHNCKNSLNSHLYIAGAEPNVLPVWVRQQEQLLPSNQPCLLCQPWPPALLQIHWWVAEYNIFHLPSSSWKEIPNQLTAHAEHINLLE